MRLNVPCSYADPVLSRLYGLNDRTSLQTTNYRIISSMLLYISAGQQVAAESDCYYWHVTTVSGVQDSKVSE
jgi:hypothetical protein